MRVEHAGFEIDHRVSVGSTNEEARLLAEQGAEDRTVVWAVSYTHLTLPTNREV
mgnify:CR=1 FL=1